MFTRGAFSLLAFALALISIVFTIGNIMQAPDRDGAGVAASMPGPAGRYSPARLGNDVRDGFSRDGGRWCEYRDEKTFDPLHGETFYVPVKVCL